MQSIRNWGLIVICENYESCVELSNNFAPEHLEILALDSEKILKGIENAGAIFLGKWTPEAVGVIWLDQIILYLHQEILDLAVLWELKLS